MIQHFLRKLRYGWDLAAFHRQSHSLFSFFTNSFSSAYLLWAWSTGGRALLGLCMDSEGVGSNNHTSLFFPLLSAPSQILSLKLLGWWAAQCTAIVSMSCKGQEDVHPTFQQTEQEVVPAVLQLKPFSTLARRPGLSLATDTKFLEVFRPPS